MRLRVIGMERGGSNRLRPRTGCRMAQLARRRQVGQIVEISVGVRGLAALDPMQDV